MLKLKLISPEKVELELNDVKSVKLRSSNGDLTILTNHMNIMTSLLAGTFLIKTFDEKEYSYYITGGFLELNNNDLTVIVEEIYESSSEEEVRKIKLEKLNKAIESKRKEDKDIVGIKKRIQDTLKKY